MLGHANKINFNDIRLGLQVFTYLNWVFTVKYNSKILEIGKINQQSKKYNNSFTNTLTSKTIYHDANIYNDKNIVSSTSEYYSLL